MVRFSGSFFTSLSVIESIPTRGLVWGAVGGVGLGLRLAVGEDLVHLLDTASPDRRILVEQSVDGAEGLGVTAHQLFSALAAFADQLSTLHNCDVFLHRGEAHRVALGQR